MYGAPMFRVRFVRVIERRPGGIELSIVFRHLFYTQVALTRRVIVFR